MGGDKGRGELPERFSDERRCREHLEGLRWPDGFVCRSCGGRVAWRTGAGRLICASCRNVTSVTAGTIFHRSRVGLRVWFAGAWLATEGSAGVSALELQRVLGVGSYETAWAMLHRFRRVMASAAPRRLSGTVEVALAEVDVVERGRARALRNGVATVAIAVETRPSPRGGLLRLEELDGSSELQILDFVRRGIEPGATVRSDGSPLFARLGDTGLRHVVRDPGHRRSEAVGVLGEVESFLGSWTSGSLHRGVSDAHLAYYLDELAFRWNIPAAPGSGRRFDALLEHAVRYEPAPFSDLVGGTLPLVR